MLSFIQTSRRTLVDCDYLSDEKKFEDAIIEYDFSTQEAKSAVDNVEKLLIELKDVKEVEHVQKEQLRWGLASHLKMGKSPQVAKQETIDQDGSEIISELSEKFEYYSTDMMSDDIMRISLDSPFHPSREPSTVKEIEEQIIEISTDCGVRIRENLIELLQDGIPPSKATAKVRNEYSSKSQIEGNVTDKMNNSSFAEQSNSSPRDSQIQANSSFSTAISSTQEESGSSATDYEL